MSKNVANSRKYNSRLFPLIFAFFIIVILLSVKILLQVKGKVLGIDYITVLDKEYLIFAKDGSKLKYFYEPKPNLVSIVHKKWLSYDVKNTLNSDGLNERYEYSQSKEKNVYRILIIGDSFTYGYLVDTSENYTELLEDILNLHLSCPGINKYEVINLGVTGYDIAYTLERFKTRGIKYDPNLVIWLLQEINFKYNDYLLPLEHSLITKGVTEFDDKLQIYTAHEQALKIINKDLGEEAMFNLSKDNMYKLPIFYSNNLLLVTFSFTKQKYVDSMKEFVSLNPNSKLYTSLVNIYANKDYYLSDKHPSKLGHKAIADDLFSYLKSNYFNNCENK